MANQTPTVGEIRRAQSQAVGGGRKRCRKGKNCSAACIQAGMVCLVEMPESAGVATTRMRDYLKEWKPKNPYLSPKPSKSVGDYTPIRRLAGEELVNTAWELAKEGKTPAEIVKATGYWKDNDSFNKAIKEYRPKTKERLEGDNLMKLVKNMPPETTKPDMIRAAGYSSWGSNGKEKLHWTEFYEALVNAKELPEFKQAGGYRFRQKITPIPEKELPTKEKLQRLFFADDWEIDEWKGNIHKLLGSGAVLPGESQKTGPKIHFTGDTLTLKRWVFNPQYNEMDLSVDNEGTILWKVNGSVSRNDNKEISSQGKRQMAIEARKMWDTMLRGFDEGTILTTSAYTEDGGGESRARAYQAMGFGEPDGGPGGRQYGQITGNGLRPLDPVDGYDRYRDQYGYGDDDDDDNDFAESSPGSRKKFNDKEIDDAFMVILFGEI